MIATSLSSGVLNTWCKAMALRFSRLVEAPGPVFETLLRTGAQLLAVKGELRRARGIGLVMLRNKLFLIKQQLVR